MEVEGRRSVRARKCGRYSKISEGVGKANKDSKKRRKKKFYDNL